MHSAYVFRRTGTNMDASDICAGGERVERQRIPLERRAVASQPLGCGARDGDPDGFASRQLLRSCRSVDDDALPRSCRADEHAYTLGTSQDEQRHLLLVGERSPDTLGDLARAAFIRAAWPTSRPAARASVAARRSIACSCARTASVVICPPSSVSTRRSRIISRATCSASFGESSPAVCSRATVWRSRSSKTA